MNKDKNVAYDYDIYGNRIRKFVKTQNKEGGSWRFVPEFVPEKGFDKERSKREVIKG